MPVRAPLVCGALGTYQRARVLAIAASLGADVGLAHEGEGSILMLDREPLAWSGRRESGLGWIEGAAWRDGAADWREASRRGACGLAVEGRRRFLHSSVNGLGPIYWIEDGGAAYFASRIDPLVATSPRRLSVDWDAWAAIIALRYPLGERTPFAEVRRLAPFSTLGRRFGRFRSSSPTWPWLEIDPVASLDAGADAVAAAIEEALDPLETIEVCLLSGGRDSRMLLAAAVKAGFRPTAVTVGDDEGARFEQDLAIPVAAALGVEHEMLETAADAYPGEWELRADEVEYQFVDHAWLVPVAKRIEGLASPVPDGFALDTMLKAGNHFYTPETRDRRHPRRASTALFEQLRRYGDAPQAIAEPLRKPLLARAREQFRKEVRHLQGHPWQAELSLYATRTVRGISTYPSALLGRRADILLPGASDALAHAALSVNAQAKEEDGLYMAVLDRLAPAVRHLPSTNETPRSAIHLPRRWRSPQAVAAHRARLAEGPFAGHVDPDLEAWLAAPDGVEISPDQRLGMESLSLFHAWWQRYRDRLREVDVGELGG